MIRRAKSRLLGVFSLNVILAIFSSYLTDVNAHCYIVDGLIVTVNVFCLATLLNAGSNYFED